ncbi:MAG: RNA polymerase factor sigma-54 [Bacteroidales bacterium]
MLKQQLQQKQQQRLTPQQVQLIRMLELTTLELEEKVAQELEENPALEEGKDSNDENGSEFEEEDYGDNSEDMTLGDYANEEEVPSYKVDDYNRSKESKADAFNWGDTKSLHEYLIEQLGIRNLSEDDHRIAEYIIGNIDEDGYLRRTIEAISDDLLFQVGLDVDTNHLKEILDMIQDFDPPGIGASTLQESLLLQLERRKGTEINRLAFQVIQNHFDDFSNRRYEKIIQKYNLSECQMKDLITDIQSLNPKPGNYCDDDIYQESSKVVIPDFYVEESEGLLYLSMNGNNIPELTVNRQYSEMIQNFKANKANRTRENKETLVFIKQKLESARLFIDAIRERQTTLMRTMQAIVDFQKEFFITGEETRLRPMTLKDVSELCKYDISTVSRVSSSKYVQTSYGIFSLKYFFSDSMHTESGEEISNKEIKAILRDCIAGEDKRKPLPDEKLSEILQQKGYIIARRTIAKYREQLGIPVARLRKEI